MCTIDAPQIFNIAYALIKPFLNEATKKKISIYGSDKSQWGPILDAIDAEELPVSYGGTMTDPDGNPHCITKVSLVQGAKHCCI